LIEGGKAMRRILLSFVIVLFTSLLIAIPTEEELLSIAAEDAYNSFQSGQYGILDGWKMDGWIRVGTTPKYQYFDNLPEELRNTYYYRLTLELNRFYFRKLEEEGDFDPLFYNEELLKTVQLLPKSRDEISRFVNHLMNDNPELENAVQRMGEYLSNDALNRFTASYNRTMYDAFWAKKVDLEKENIMEILEKYELGLMSDEWEKEFWDELNSYVQKAADSEFGNTLLIVAIATGVMVLIAAITILMF